jgi:hypothetical protein
MLLKMTVLGTLPFPKNTAEHATEEVAALWLLLLLHLAAAEHTTEYRADEVADTALLLCLLCATQQYARQIAETHISLALCTAKHPHEDGREYGHQFHHLTSIEAGGLANMLCRCLLLPAEYVAEYAHTVQGALGLATALHHSTYHTCEVIQDAAVMVAVQCSTERGEAAFAVCIVCQSAEQGAKDALGCCCGLLWFSTDVLAHLPDHFVGELALEDIH